MPGQPSGNEFFVVKAGDWVAEAFDTVFKSDGILAATLGLYNTVFMAIGGTLLLWLMTRAVVETAQHGKIGGRHSEVWFPIRFFLAVGLLVPLPPVGLNAGEYIVIGVARMGVAAGSVIWTKAVEQTAQMKPLIVPVPPEVRELARGMFMVEFCTAMQNRAAAASEGATIREVPETGAIRTRYSADGDRSAGGIKAQCGAVSYRRPLGVSENLSGSASKVLAAHVKAGRDLQQALRPAAVALAATLMPPFTEQQTRGPELDVVSAMRRYTTEIMTVTRQEVTQQNSRMDAFKRAATDGGWVKAGAWGLNLLSTNQTVMDAVYSLPSVDPPRYEWWGGEVFQAQRAALHGAERWWNERYGQKTSTADWDAYNATQDTSSFWQLTSIFDLSRYKTVYDWVLLGDDQAAPGGNTAPGRALGLDFGSNPISEMVGLGHSLLNVFWGAVLSYIGLRASAAFANEAADNSLVGTLIDAVSGTATGSTGALLEALRAIGPIVWLLLMGLLAAGVMLAYVLPMTPALIWLFSVARYMMRVVISVLGAPVWAVAHLELEGEGVGQKASQGYVILYDLLVRPMIMTLGLVFGYAMMMMFGKLFALVYFESVRNTLTGHFGGITGLVVYSIMGASTIVTLCSIAMWGVSKGADYIMEMVGQRVFRDEDPERDAAAAGQKTGGAAKQAEQATVMGSGARTPPRPPTLTAEPAGAGSWARMEDIPRADKTMR